MEGKTGLQYKVEGRRETGGEKKRLQTKDNCLVHVKWIRLTTMVILVHKELKAATSEEYCMFQGGNGENKRLF